MAASPEIAARVVSHCPTTDPAVARALLARFGDDYLNRFDPQTIADRATYEKPHQYPVGIGTVVVNGVVTVRNGQHTGAHAGRALYGAEHASR